MKSPMIFQEVGPGCRKRRGPDVRGWVAAPVGGEEIGSVICRVQGDEEFEIVDLVVEAGARRRGIGQGLVAAAMEGAAFHGHRKVSVRVPAGQPGLIPLFLGLGFKPVGAGASESNFVLERQLDDWLDSEVLGEGEVRPVAAAPEPFTCKWLAP